MDETEETLLYGKRALICVDASSLAKHGEGPAALDGEDTSAASGLSPADRRSLMLSFYSHAAPLLPRMCRAAGEVGAMEGKGGAGPRTSEVYMCSEVCRTVCFLPAPRISPRMRPIGLLHYRPALRCRWLSCLSGLFAGLFACGCGSHTGHCLCADVANGPALRPCAPGGGAD